MPAAAARPAYFATLANACLLLLVLWNVFPVALPFAAAVAELAMQSGRTCGCEPADMLGHGFREQLAQEQFGRNYYRFCGRQGVLCGRVGA